MFKELDQRLKAGEAGSLYTLAASCVTGVALFIVLFETSLTSSFTVWAKGAMLLLGVVISGVFWTKVGTVLDGMIQRKQKAKERRECWGNFLKHTGIPGGDLELHTAEGRIRGPILDFKRDGDEILFERTWLAQLLSQSEGWQPIEAHAGTDFRIPDEIEAPVKRVDGTYFISLPEGSVAIYPREHPDRFDLKKVTSLEPLQVETQAK